MEDISLRVRGVENPVEILIKGGTVAENVEDIYVYFEAPEAEIEHNGEQLSGKSVPLSRLLGTKVLNAGDTHTVRLDVSGSGPILVSCEELDVEETISVSDGSIDI